MLTNGFDLSGLLFTPVSNASAALSNNVTALAQGAEAVVNSLCTLSIELGRFAVERLERHIDVASGVLESGEPGHAFTQVSDYLYETLEAWDAEQSRLIGLLAQTMTDSMLGEYSGKGVGVWPLP